ncbi:MAG: hypothetical protein ACRD3W_32150, partial [Terriglobales bacterium]
MQIVFGWHLDGCAFPETVDRSCATIDSAVLGPRGLIGLLEFRFGLGGPQIPPVVRIAQYLRRLQSVDDGRQFYSRSFAEDRWGVAELLLAMRDELISGGWNGSELGEISRLKTFAALESSDLGPLLPGDADRFMAVKQALARGKTNPNISPITVTTPLQNLPPAWQQLLELMKGAIEIEEQLPSPQALAGTDLALLQTAFTKYGAHDPLTNDGTVSLLEADDEVQAADAVAAWLASDEQSNGDLVIVRGASTNLLDAACHAIGLPRVGGEALSRWRSALQVLPLSLELLWKPLNPSRLVELLTLPSTPIIGTVG